MIDRAEFLWQALSAASNALGHVLKDLAKLQNDLLYILTP